MTLVQTALLADRRADQQEQRADALEELLLVTFQEAHTYRFMCKVLLEMWYAEKTARHRTERRLREFLEMPDDASESC